jgi:hypothetical protein
MDLYSCNCKIKEKELIQAIYQSIRSWYNLGAVGCNYECFLYSGGDDWESLVLLRKKREKEEKNYIFFYEKKFW